MKSISAEASGESSVNCSRSKAPRRVGIISNKRVFDLYGREVVRSLKAAGFKVFEWLMPEGERYKSFSIAGESGHVSQRKPL